jgi:hypothetical protein
MFTLRIALYLGVVAVTAVALAAPLPQSHEGQPDSNQSSTTWSKEEIFNLVSVFIAISGVLVAIGPAVYRHMRRKRMHCLLFPLAVYCVRSHNIAGCNYNDSKKQLHKKYEEWLKFQEWMDLTDGRRSP